MAAGYDQIAERYASWGAEVPNGVRQRYLARVRDLLSSGAAVLDLGCGTGQHLTRHLAHSYSVVGVDVSLRSLAVARREVRDATFVAADIGSVAFRPRSFDAVVAFFSLIHVPRGEHAEVLKRVATWLRPGGWFVATMGAGQGSDGIGDFLGVDMYWSSWGADINIDLTRAAGLDVVSAVEHAERENGVIRHLWIVAQR